MHRLAIVIFSLVFPTLMGVGVVIALVSGVTTLWPLLGAAALGAIAAIPVSLGVAKALSN